jgi:hypothetical protein
MLYSRSRASTKKSTRAAALVSMEAGMDETTRKIRALNFQVWRDPLAYARVMMTPGVRDKGYLFLAKCLKTQREFVAWTPDYDPHHEADMGVLRGRRRNAHLQDQTLTTGHWSTDRLIPPVPRRPLECSRSCWRATTNARSAPHTL